MIDINKKRETIGKILRNPTFSKSSINVHLLAYLFECSLKDHAPSEKDIATHVFGRHSDYNPSTDNFVRVYMYNLRKKLEGYYQSDGLDDALIVNIPKGHYHMEFVEKRQEKEGTKKWLRYILAGLLVVCIAIVFSIFQFNLSFLRNSSYYSIRNNFIWKNYLDSDKKTTLTYGHLFSFYQYDSELRRYRLVFDNDIQTQEDLDYFIDRNALPPEYYHLPDWDILPKSTIVNLNTLQPLFFRSGKKLEITSSRDISWTTITQTNIIFVGHFTNLYKLEKFYPDERISYHLDEAEHVRVRSTEKEVTYSFINTVSDQHSKKYVRDYVHLAKIAGPNNNALLYLVSFHQVGRIQVIDMLVDTQGVSECENLVREKLGHVPEFFEILWQVDAYEDTPLEMEMKYCSPLQQTFNMTKQ